MTANFPSMILAHGDVAVGGYEMSTLEAINPYRLENSKFKFESFKASRLAQGRKARHGSMHWL